MNSILPILLCVTLIVSVHGTSDSVNQHAVELAEVVQKIWDSRPDIFNRIEPMLQCQMLDLCCEDQARSAAIAHFIGSSYAASSRPFHRLMRKCIYSNTSKPFFKPCVDMERAVRESWKLDNNPDVEQYGDILTEQMYKLKKLSFMHSIEFNCSGEEIHGLFCKSNTKLTASCVEKLLRQVYDFDPENYEENAQAILQIFNDGYENAVETFSTKA